MGVETLIIAGIGMGLMQASSTTGNASSQAKATVAAGKQSAENMAKQVAAKAASQKVSFLSSGLTLEGTPLAAITSTFETGRQDINQIISNANTNSKNIMSEARSKALSQVMSGAMTGMSAGGGMGSFFGSSGMTQGAAMSGNMYTTSGSAIGATY